jgi:excisionase family DNA binding protein
MKTLTMIPINPLTPYQAAEILGVSHITVRRLIKRGVLPSTKWGRDYMLNKDVIEEFSKTYKRWTHYDKKSE